MAIADVKKRKIGRQLTDWIYLGIRTGARRSTAEYRAMKAAGDMSGAVGHLTRAVNMPNRARNRITEWIRAYDLSNGAGAGQSLLTECLLLAGGVTLVDIDSELTALENQANSLISANQAGGALDELAASIEGALDWEAKDWEFPLPVDYSDIGLMDN